MYSWSKHLLLISMLMSGKGAIAQFEPQAGISGSTAIHKSDLSIKGWANKSSITRGYIDYRDKSLGRVTTGDDINAEGSVDGTIVSLGDSGIAILQFVQPIYNGPGTDFAVFENGFSNPTNSEEAFLELAYVEVSSDGVHYVRFPSISHIQTDVQIRGAGDYTDARKIHNLAGKYIAQYGTPFDLDDVKDTEGLDVNHITHIRLVDIVGDITSDICKDQYGTVINDPFPTPFPTGGFDLDAVGVMHLKGTSIGDVYQAPTCSVFPNPCTDYLTIQHLPHNGIKEGVLTFRNQLGQVVLQSIISSERQSISIKALPSGIYHLTFSNQQNPSLWHGSVQVL